MRARLRLAVIRAATATAILGLGACSPYLYEDEIKTFSSGVDTAVVSLQTYLDKAAKAHQEQRFANLKKAAAGGKKIGVSAGCVKLQADLEASLDDPLSYRIDRSELAKCQVLPVPNPPPGPVYANFNALGQSLQDYAAALGVITNAGDSESLVSASGRLTSKINGLIAEVNKATGSEISTDSIRPVGNVLREGLTLYLNQRRFDTLKTAVNKAQPAIEQTAMLLARAMTQMFLNDVGQRFLELNDTALMGDTATGDDFVSVWIAAQQKRDVLVQQLKNNPNVILRSLVISHKALVDSINDPADEQQLGAVIQNVKAFYDAARALEMALKPEDG